MKYVDWSNFVIWVYSYNVLLSSVSQWVNCEDEKKDDFPGPGPSFDKAGDSLNKDYNTVSGHKKEGVNSAIVDQNPLQHDNVPEKDMKGEISALDLYRLLFREKRKSHKEAVKAILGFKVYDKQYNMVKLIMDKMFSTTEEAKVFLMEAGFTPGDHFPTNEKMRNALSMIMENTVFFGDILLHLPDITHDLMRRNKKWDLMARWGISFCNDTKVYEASERKLLNLMAQELDIIEKDPNYVNPYKINQKEFQEEIENLLKDSAEEPAKKDTKKKKRKERTRGPRLSSIPHSEL